jgi:hypothetical protein
MAKQGYDIAQICINGHYITDRYDSRPEFRKKFCKKCGQPTIHECQECKSPIQGYFHRPNVTSLLSYPPPPAFCHECGEPYPWTTAKIEAAREYVDELEELDIQEKASFKISIDEIAKDTPKGEVAIKRISKLMKKLSGDAYKQMKQILVEISSETLKKLIESNL